MLTLSLSFPLYPLTGRSAKSNIQGSIRLKLWLSTREDRGLSEEEELWNEIRQEEQIYAVFLEHQLTHVMGEVYRLKSVALMNRTEIEHFEGFFFAEFRALTILTYYAICISAHCGCSHVRIMPFSHQANFPQPQRIK